MGSWTRAPTAPSSPPSVRRPQNAGFRLAWALWRDSTGPESAESVDKLIAESPVRDPPHENQAEMWKLGIAHMTRRAGLAAWSYAATASNAPASRPTPVGLLRDARLRVAIWPASISRSAVGSTIRILGTPSSRRVIP